MPGTETNQDPAEIALAALTWTLGDPRRADRLLAMTGLTPDELRGRLTDPALLAATLAFLEAHEPDLVACADALAIKPEALVRARMDMDA